MVWISIDQGPKSSKKANPQFSETKSNTICDISADSETQRNYIFHVLCYLQSRRNVFATGLKWKHDQYIIFLCALLYPPPDRAIIHCPTMEKKVTIIVLNVVFFHLKKKNIIIVQIS